MTWGHIADHKNAASPPGSDKGPVKQDPAFVPGGAPSSISPYIGPPYLSRIVLTASDQRSGLLVGMKSARPSRTSLKRKLSTEIEPLPSLSFRPPAVLRLGDVVIAFEEWSSTKNHPCRSFLGEDDKKRLSRLRSPLSRAEFIAGRAALHHAGRALGHDVSEMRINYDPDSGKPYFDSIDACFHFNITHTIGLAGCIASRNCLVGCDCERWDRALNIEEFSYLFDRKFLNKRECLIEWTKLEASTKLRGEKLTDRVGSMDKLISPTFMRTDEIEIDIPLSPVTFDINRKFVFSCCVELTPHASRRISSSTPGDDCRIPYRQRSVAEGEAQGGSFKRPEQ